jgi:hypothetical protein
MARKAYPVTRATLDFFDLLAPWVSDGDESKTMIMTTSQHGALPRITRQTTARQRLVAQYAAHLDQLRAQGRVRWYRAEGMQLRLGQDTTYTPDFAVMLADGAIEMHEVCSRRLDGAAVRLKVAAALYPFRFVAVRPMARQDGGGWQQETF